jgi:hypothetical protein
VPVGYAAVRRLLCELRLRSEPAVQGYDRSVPDVLQTPLLARSILIQVGPITEERPGMNKISGEGSSTFGGVSIESFNSSRAIFELP